MAGRQSEPRVEQLDLEIQCPVRTRVLGIMRTFVSCVAGQMGFDEEECDKIEMAVDEACANVVRHAYKHLGVSPDLPEEDRENDPELTRGCTINMRISFNDDMLEIVIADHGIGVDKKPKGVDSVAEFESRGGHGGLGVFIIRNFMDEVFIEPQRESGTKVVMRKYLKSSAASSGRESSQH